MTVAPKQPEIRFNYAGPMSLGGISYLPKTILVEKTVTTAASTDDFLTVPTKTYIVQAIAVVTDACDANTEVTLGTDGTADAIFTTTALSVETLGNSAIFNTGLFLNAGDTLRITVGGTPAAGAVSFLLTYFEIDAMRERGAHFSL